MKKYIHFIIFIIFISVSSSAGAQTEKTPAFPGAEGYARYITGGRGGNVYHVTNLNDSGEGSLRWALGKSGKKIIVFDVSGTIHLQSALSIPSNTTIAGQSAPGDGICIADFPCSINGNNVIVRYMRFRLGNVNVNVDKADGWDGFGAMDQQNIIIDHCSVSWSIDECLSVLGNKNTTVQWCLVAQSLVDAGHSKGNHGYGGNWGGSGASFHHNMIIHHTSRTPRLGPRPTTQLGERMDMRNNVIYNFGGNGCYGGEGMNVNIVNNYYKPGPGSPTNYKGKRIAGIGVRTNEYITTYPAYAPALHLWGKFYVTGNVNSQYSDVTNDNWTYGMYNQIDADGNDGTYTQETKDTIRINEPIPYIYTTTHTAEQAYEKVLNYAGASLHRDSFDELMVSDARNGTATYTGSGLGQGFINSQNDNRPANAGEDWSAWPTLQSTAAPTDTDGDGIPDTWEQANGLNPNDATDGQVIGDDGYTAVERYLNSLVEDITKQQNSGGTVMGNIETIEGETEKKSYELSNATHSEEWNFDGGFSVTNEKGKTYSPGSNNCVKYSSGVQYTINIPDGLSVTAVQLYGYDNYAEGDSYLGELNGITYPATDYVFPKKEDSHAVMKSYKISLETPATKTLTFTPKGQQVVWIITLETEKTTSSILRVDSKQEHSGKIYNLRGMEIRQPRQGIYIKNGKKIIVR